MKSTKGASEAMRTQSNLMLQLSKAGLPLLGQQLRYSEGALNQLDQKGLPSYVQQGYGAAKTAALEQAVAESTGARRPLGSDSASAMFRAAPAFSGAAEAYAKENASIQAAKATATLSQRNQLLQSMSGGGAQSINLSAGFGGLTNRALAVGVNAGNPLFESVVGGTAALAPIALTALQRPYQGQSFLESYANQQVGRGQPLAPMG